MIQLSNYLAVNLGHDAEEIFFCQVAGINPSVVDAPCNPAEARLAHKPVRDEQPLPAKERDLAGAKRAVRNLLHLQPIAGLNHGQHGASGACDIGRPQIGRGDMRDRQGAQCSAAGEQDQDNCSENEVEFHGKGPKLSGPLPNWRAAFQRLTSQNSASRLKPSSPHAISAQSNLRFDG